MKNLGLDRYCLDFLFKPFEEMKPGIMARSKVFKSGLELHQQLLTQKKTFLAAVVCRAI